MLFYFLRERDTGNASVADVILRILRIPAMRRNRWPAGAAEPGGLQCRAGRRKWIGRGHQRQQRENGRRKRPRRCVCVCVCVSTAAMLTLENAPLRQQCAECGNSRKKNKNKHRPSFGGCSADCDLLSEPKVNEAVASLAFRENLCESWRWDAVQALWLATIPNPMLKEWQRQRNLSPKKRERTSLKPMCEQKPRTLSWGLSRSMDLNCARVRSHVLRLSTPPFHNAARAKW